MKKLLLALTIALSLATSCVRSPEAPVIPRDVSAAAVRTVAIQIVGVMISFQGERPRLAPFKRIASGVIVAPGEVLTAAHVCRIDLPPEFQASASRTLVLGADAVVRRAKEVRRDDRSELCLLSVPGIKGPALELAEHQPPYGARVSYYGAPMGSYRPGEPFIGDGRAIGSRRFSERTWAAYSAPTIGGASGSGVYVGGKLCGVVVATSMPFHHLMFSSSLGQIRAFLGVKR
jgi:hypothetical protein